MPFSVIVFFWPFRLHFYALYPSISIYLSAENNTSGIWQIGHKFKRAYPLVNLLVFNKTLCCSQYVRLLPTLCNFKHYDFIFLTKSIIPDNKKICQRALIFISPKLFCQGHSQTNLFIFFKECHFFIYFSRLDLIPQVTECEFLIDFFYNWNGRQIKGNIKRVICFWKFYCFIYR